MKLQWNVYRTGNSNRVHVVLKIDDSQQGALTMSVERWEVLRFILIEGSRRYVDNEAEIIINDIEVVHAFTHGSPKREARRD